ncbi:hypothetical protein PFISCL1PPCAC_7202, partial [Pristionchus fissidentatus]
LVQERGFSTADELTRLLQLRGEIYDVIKMLWHEAMLPISMNMLRVNLQLVGCNKEEIGRVLEFVSERLNSLSETEGCRSISRAIAYIATNTTVLLKDGPNSIFFVPYSEEDMPKTDDSGLFAGEK